MTITTSSKGAVTDALNTDVPANPDIVEGSPYYLLVHETGQYAEKVVQLTGNGASTENLFVIEGGLRFTELSFSVTSVSDSTTFSGVKFELDDGTIQTDVTTAVDGSGCLAGAFFLKTNTSANPLLFVDNSTVDYADALLSKTLADFLAVAKSGATTYLRLAYTGDADTDITIHAVCHYAPLTVGADVSAA